MPGRGDGRFNSWHYTCGCFSCHLQCRAQRRFTGLALLLCLVAPVGLLALAFQRDSRRWKRRRWESVARDKASLLGEINRASIPHPIAVDQIISLDSSGLLWYNGGKTHVRRHFLLRSDSSAAFLNELSKSMSLIVRLYNQHHAHACSA